MDKEVVVHIHNGILASWVLQMKIKSIMVSGFVPCYVEQVPALERVLLEDTDLVCLMLSLASPSTKIMSSTNYVLNEGLLI